MVRAPKRRANDSHRFEEDSVKKLLLTAGMLIGVGGVTLVVPALRVPGNDALAKASTAECPVTYSSLRTNLIQADSDDTTGLNNHYWAVVLDREGVVCAVAYSGEARTSQWLLSRQIAAAKAFTANGLSLDSAPLSTAQLYPWVQPGAPGNPLFGLAAGNPVSPADAYKGQYAQFGTASDPMVGERVGGTITFGGGLALYSGTTAIGGLGLSGDTACADHSTAWRVRDLLGLAPAAGDDRITLDNVSGHPHCPNDGATQGAH
jgi:uncharacterized protein GlcG (DUF336 family)